MKIQHMRKHARPFFFLSHAKRTARLPKRGTGDEANYSAVNLQSASWNMNTERAHPEILLIIHHHNYIHVHRLHLQQ